MEVSKVQLKININKTKVLGLTGHCTFLFALMVRTSNALVNLYIYEALFLPTGTPQFGSKV